MSITYRSGITSVRDDPENRQGVHESDLSSYKDSNYFDAYVDTFSVMYIKEKEGTFRQAVFNTKDKDSRSLESVRGESYNTLKELKFGQIETATFAGSIVVKSNGSTITVRSTDITIPGVLKVYKGTKEVTQQVNIGDITVMKFEGTNFDFYQYGDNLIKATKGTVIEDYITLKSL